MSDRRDRKELLKIQDLKVEYRTEDGVVSAVNGISFTVNEGETLGLLGETGAGKTTTGLSILRLLPERTGYITDGTIQFMNENILEMDKNSMRSIRGRKISMIFQDPMTSLNPVLTVGEQIEESIFLHNPKMPKAEIEERAESMLKMVGIVPERKKEYPHQFSGGMKQRVVIAMALACDPALVIADEPTTALDVTIQAQVLKMMAELKKEKKTSIIMITHDLGVIAKTCDKVAVMYAGEIVESGSIKDLFLEESHHPYTIGLFGSLPEMNDNSKRLKSIAGMMPNPMDLPRGCKFHPRCPECMEICKEKKPDYYIQGSHAIACHRFAKEG